MDRAHFIFGIYILFFAVFFALIFATPLVAFARDASGLYQFFSATCHQKISRSLCIFEDGRVGDCTAQSGQFVDNENDRAQTSAVVDGKLGYKMPVCARDIGIYGGMLLVAMLYPLVRRIDDIDVPPVLYLIIAIAPLAIDGTIQLVSDLGWLPFVYESTNLIRLATGLLAGGAASYYAIPLLMNMFGEEKTERRAYTARKDSGKSLAPVGTNMLKTHKKTV